jgi:hypothetical protein
MAPVRLSPSGHCPSQLSRFSLAAASSARKVVEVFAICAMIIGVCARRWGTWSAAITAVVTLLFSGPTAAYVASPDNLSSASEPCVTADAEHDHHLEQGVAAEFAFEQSTVTEENDPVAAKKLVAALGSHPHFSCGVAEVFGSHGHIRAAFGFREGTRTEHAPRGPPAL